MRWKKFVDKIEGKEVGGGDAGIMPTPGHALPFIGWLVRNFKWRDVATLDLDAERAKAGFCVGYIVGGNAFVVAAVLTSPKVGIIIGPQKYKVFAIDRNGREIGFALGQGRLDFLSSWLNDYYVF